MPILIWDNGGAYSDHAIYFIDCGTVPATEVEALLSKAKEGHVLAVVERVKWRDPKAVTTLADFVRYRRDFYGFHHEDCGDVWPCSCWVTDLCRLAGVEP